jgi:hypothetical protein
LNRGASFGQLDDVSELLENDREVNVQNLVVRVETVEQPFEELFVFPLKFEQEVDQVKEARLKIAHFHIQGLVEVSDRLDYPNTSVFD